MIKKFKKLFSAVLVAAMAVCMMPNLNMTVKAADCPTPSYPAYQCWNKSNGGATGDCLFTKCESSADDSCSWNCDTHYNTASVTHVGGECPYCVYGTPPAKPTNETCSKHDGVLHVYSFGDTFKSFTGSTCVKCYIYRTDGNVELSMPGRAGTVCYAAEFPNGYAEGWYYVGGGYVPCDGHGSGGGSGSGDNGSGNGGSCSPATPSKSEPAAAPTVPTDYVAERVAEEEAMDITIVTIDTTQYSKSEESVVPGTSYNLSKFVTTKGIVKGIKTAVTAANNNKKDVAEIYTGKPFCFNKEIIKAIQEGNKTVVYYFAHEGHIYSVTVPATVDAAKVLEKAGFAGPLYVGQQLGTTRLIK